MAKKEEIKEESKEVKTPEQTQKEYERFMKSLEEKYNVRVASKIQQDNVIRTGIYALDYVLAGGLRYRNGGHRIEFFGAESCGKTSFALKIIAKYQTLGMKCVYMDAEHSYDKQWAEILGVDNNTLQIVEPDTLEDAGDLFALLIPRVDLIVWDSVTTLIPATEIENETIQQTMGLQSRINAQITRKIYNAIAKRPTTLIFLNQLREKIGVMYGNPETTGGGRALKHLYNTRIQFRSGQPIEIAPNGDNEESDDKKKGGKKERIGMEININNIKNKVGKPYNKAVVDFYYTGNIDNKKTVFFSGLKYCLIAKNGNTYNYGEEKAVGQNNFMEKVMTDEVTRKIEEEIWARTK